jgi:hypothetical protein
MQNHLFPLDCSSRRHLEPVTVLTMHLTVRKNSFRSPHTGNINPDRQVIAELTTMGKGANFSLMIARKVVSYRAPLASFTFRLNTSRTV